MNVMGRYGSDSSRNYMAALRYRGHGAHDRRRVPPCCGVRASHQQRGRSGRTGTAARAREILVRPCDGGGGRAAAGRIRRVTEQLFDFHEMSRRMLGVHWQEGSVPQQEEFVQLFTEMLERMYLTNIASLPLAASEVRGRADLGGLCARQLPDCRPPWRHVGRVPAGGPRRAVGNLRHRRRGSENLVSSYRSRSSIRYCAASFASLLERLRSREAERPNRAGAVEGHHGTHDIRWIDPSAPRRFRVDESTSSKRSRNAIATSTPIMSACHSVPEPSCTSSSSFSGRQAS